MDEPKQGTKRDHWAHCDLVLAARNGTNQQVHRQPRPTHLRPALWCPNLAVPQFSRRVCGPVLSLNCAVRQPTGFWSFGDNCQGSHFHDQNIIFDITLCGQAAGPGFASFCPAAAAGRNGSTSWNKCNDFVLHNGSAFSDAYWLVNRVAVYTTGTAGTGNHPPGGTPTWAWVVAGLAVALGAVAIAGWIYYMQCCACGEDEKQDRLLDHESSINGRISDGVQFQ
jgi:hypothetical protein